MKVLAISGSLRAASINSAFCRAAAQLAQPPTQVKLFAGLDSLPLFNPDLEFAPPSSVLEFRAAIDHADVLLIASPEYAHGISGVMKNALDWLVGFEGFVHKPVAVVNTSPRARHAHDALIEVLKTMSATIVHEASIALLGSCITEVAMIASFEASTVIRNVLQTIADSQAQTAPATSLVEH